MRTSHRAGFSKTNGLGQYFRTRPRCNRTSLQGKHKTQIEGTMTITKYLGKWKIGTALDVFVSEDEGVICAETKAPSSSRMKALRG